jgi:dihydroorotase
MVATNRMTWSDVARVMSVNPARIGRVSEHGQEIAVGTSANITLIDPARVTVVDPKNTASKSHNNPFSGMELRGAVTLTMLRGRVTFEGDK